MKIIILVIICLCALGIVTNSYLHKNCREAFEKEDSYVEDGMSQMEISKDKKYSYRINEGENTVEIIGYLKKNVDSLHIPEKIDGLKVTSLGEASFAYHEELKCIKVPKTVTSMKMAVFGSSVNLEKVYFAGDVKNIDDWAFGDFAGTIVIENNKCTKLYKYAVDNKISME